MKTKLSLALTLILLVSLLIAPASASAEAEVIECTGTNTLIGVTSMGEWTYPDGNIHIRGMTVIYLGMNDCMGGPTLYKVTMNANFDSNKTGPIWGTMEPLDYTAPGAFVGTYTGEELADGSVVIDIVGRGITEPAVGWQYRASQTQPPFGPGIVAIWTGTFLIPHSQ